MSRGGEGLRPSGKGKDPLALTNPQFRRNRSIRVVSHTGHISNEIDIAFYDPLGSFTLMKRQDVYEVYPIESVYGVVQVKSVLNARELTSALKNLATFKTLDRPPSGGFIRFTNRIPSRRGFAMLFRLVERLITPSARGRAYQMNLNLIRHPLTTATCPVFRGQLHHVSGDDLSSI